MKDKILTLKTLESRVQRGELYAIVDAIAHRDVAGYANEVISLGEAGPVAEINASEYATEDAVPYIVKISERFWRFILRDIWIQSASLPSWGLLFDIKKESHNFNVVLQHWRYWYFVELPKHDMTVHGEKESEPRYRAVFRYFDPRLTDAFINACNDVEKAAFFGPVANLYLPLADLTVRQINAPHAPDTKDTQPEINKLFVMRHKHLRALELRQLEQRIPVFRAYLEKHFEEYFLYRKIHDRDQFIHKGLNMAIHHGFLSERSAVGWLSLQLLHGPKFSQEPWAVAILNDQRQVIGQEDHAERLIKHGFELAYSQPLEKVVAS